MRGGGSRREGEQEDGEVGAGWGEKAKWEGGGGGEDGGERVTVNKGAARGIKASCVIETVDDQRMDVTNPTVSGDGDTLGAVTEPGCRDQERLDKALPDHRGQAETSLQQKIQRHGNRPTSA